MAGAAESSNGVKCNDIVVHQLVCQAGTPPAFHRLLYDLL